MQEVCPGADVTHGQLPASPVVIAMVEAQLGRTPPVLPDRTVCGQRR